MNRLITLHRPGSLLVGGWSLEVLTAQSTVSLKTFIGAPFYEVKEYYKEGTFDDCRSKWGDLFDCFHLKTLSEARSQELLRSREREKIQAHIWTFHTREEAAIAWKRKYGQLDEEN
ncbi:hypothetical protein KP509_31G016100 [Ceratopteris richardii]|uniref:Uncharacterized protein n=1 Tax=Ceratopteris richardii TaxID=49495 RepID=A0A8T2QX56_CERRI|nr:hypothetical protein KP509_31G016100 [Ceratopteris richardii]